MNGRQSHPGLVISIALATAIRQALRMDVELNRDAKQIVENWLADLNAALGRRDLDGLGALFRPDADWRYIVALTRLI